MPVKRLLVAATKATLLYADPIWRSDTSKVTFLKKARAVTRTLALRLIRGFRIISEDAAYALAGIPPLDLEIKTQYLAREGVTRQEPREWLQGVWQARWQASHRRRWT